MAAEVSVATKAAEVAEVEEVTYTMMHLKRRLSTQLLPHLDKVIFI